MDVFEKRVSIWQSFAMSVATGVAVWIGSWWSIPAFLSIWVIGAVFEGLLLGVARAKP
jgi:hypothetical protein